jgi:uncharacterized protein YegP (UPF0339 family)
MAISRKKPMFEIYQDRKGEYRWRATSPNGNVLAAASEGYVNKRDAVHCAKLFGYDPTSQPAPKPSAKAKAPAKAPTKAPAKAKAPAKPRKTPAKAAPATSPTTE